MKDNLVWVYTDETNINKIAKKFSEMYIEIYKTKNVDHKILFLIKNNDYKKLNKYCRYKFSLYDFSGFEKIKQKIKKNYILVLSIIFGIFCLFFLSNIIVNVEIIHSKEEIRTLLKNELAEYDIKRLTLKKDFQEISQIKKKILENNKDKIEWLEIETKGMKYIIRVEERLLLENEEPSNYCHVLAKKDGHIINTLVEKGNAVIKNGSYVKKNDILISGDIILNEEVVENVCAKGKIEAEVWYTINVEMPIFYEVSLKTGKMRYNFMIANNNKENIILKSRIKNKVVSNKKILSVLGYDLYLQKEEEINKIRQKYTDQEVIKEAIKRGLKKLNISLDSNAKIISQKVLKKNINNSKIYLELFVSVKEDIAIVQKIN